MIKKLIFLCLLSSPTFAWLCPGGFNSIQKGDTLSFVELQCGAPATKTISEREANVPQEWKYFIAINQPYQATGTPPLNTGANKATVKMTIAFANDQIINISVEEMSLTSTSLCGPTISAGDSSESVKSACGKPTFIQKQQTNAKPTEVVTIQYNSSKPNTLIFENGKLIQRK